MRSASLIRLVASAVVTIGRPLATQGAGVGGGHQFHAMVVTSGMTTLSVDALNARMVLAAPNRTSWTRGGQSIVAGPDASASGPSLPVEAVEFVTCRLNGRGAPVTNETERMLTDPATGPFRILRGRSLNTE